MLNNKRKPIFFHVYFHFENFHKPEVSFECIRRELEILQKYDVRGDVNFFDVMAEMIRDKNPDLLQFIQEVDMPLGYHSHFLPNPRLARIEDKEWSEAVKMYTESEGWGVEAKITREEREDMLRMNKSLVPSKLGGLVETQKIFGKKAIMECPFSSNAPVAYALRKHFNIRTAVDGGSHSFMRARRPRRPDHLWTYDEYLGHWTYLYWFMDLLFIKHPWHALSPSEDIFKKKVKNLPRDRWHMIPFAGTDHPPSDRENYYRSFENFIKYIVEKFIPRNPGSKFVTPEELLEMVVRYKERTLRKEEVRKAAIFIFQNWVGRPPTYVELDGDFLSLVEVFQVLTQSLAYYHNNGSLPESVKIDEDVIGPIGNLEEYNVLERQKVLSGDDVLATASSINIDNQIPYKIHLEPNGLEVNAAEFLLTMALELQEIHEEGRPESVDLDTAHIEPFNPTLGIAPLKMHVPYREITGFTRMNWYTRLQQWTAKPAIIKPEYLGPF